jgi:hypothetical protein
MDRLTHSQPYIHAVPTRFILEFGFKTDEDVWGGLTEIFDRLAEYEDTGRTPSEIATAEKAMSAALGLACEVQSSRNQLAAKEAEIARLKAERDAAVEDMKIMALAMRESEDMQESCCFACICDSQNLPENCILPYGECPGYERNDCFVWRGAEEEKA